MLYCRIIDRKTVKSEYQPEFVLSCDLLVAGLGTAGAMAAISGAESGLDTIGVEVFGSMGGLGTAGGIWDYSWGNPGGRFEALDERAQKVCDAVFLHTGRNSSEIGSRFIHGASKAYVLEDAARKAGCRLLFGTSVTGVYIENRRIVGIECCSGTERLNIAVKVVIDATGGQIIVRSMGLPTRTEEDRARMNFTRTRAVMEGTLVRNSPVSCGQNNSELYDDFTLSERLVDAGSQPPFLNKQSDESNRTVIVGEMPGCRDSERIYGLETLELIPCLRGEFSGDPLFYAFAPIDHVGGDLLNVSFGQKLWWIGCKMRGFGIHVPITAGMMIPAGSENLIVAGKGISVADELVGCVRMKKDMEFLGEAASKLAYIALQNGIPVSQVKAIDVRRACGTGHPDACPPLLCKLDGFMDRIPVGIPDTPESLRTLVASPDFGAAVIFALGGRLERFADEFESMLANPDTRTGMAVLWGILGIFGRKLPVSVFAALREIASKPVPPVIRDPDKLIQASAIWILGELRDRSSADFLKKLRRQYSSFRDPDDFLIGLCDRAAEAIEGAGPA